MKRISIVLIVIILICGILLFASCSQNTQKQNTPATDDEPSKSEPQKTDEIKVSLLGRAKELVDNISSLPSNFYGVNAETQAQTSGDSGESNDNSDSGDTTQYVDITSPDNNYYSSEYYDSAFDYDNGYYNFGLAEGGGFITALEMFKDNLPNEIKYNVKQLYTWINALGNNASDKYRDNYRLGYDADNDIAYIERCSTAINDETGSDSWNCIDYTYIKIISTTTLDGKILVRATQETYDDYYAIGQKVHLTLSIDYLEGDHYSFAEYYSKTFDDEYVHDAEKNVDVNGEQVQLRLFEQANDTIKCYYAHTDNMNPENDVCSSRVMVLNGDYRYIVNDLDKSVPYMIATQDGKCIFRDGVNMNYVRGYDSFFAEREEYPHGYYVDYSLRGKIIIGGEEYIDTITSSAGEAFSIDAQATYLQDGYKTVFPRISLQSENKTDFAMYDRLFADYNLSFEFGSFANMFQEYAASVQGLEIERFDVETLLNSVMQYNLFAISQDEIYEMVHQNTVNLMEQTLDETILQYINATLSGAVTIENGNVSFENITANLPKNELLIRNHDYYLTLVLKNGADVLTFDIASETYQNVDLVFGGPSNIEFVVDIHVDDSDPSVSEDERETTYALCVKVGDNENLIFSHGISYAESIPTGVYELAIYISDGAKRVSGIMPLQLEADFELVKNTDELTYVFFVKDGFLNVELQNNLLA